MKLENGKVKELDYRVSVLPTLFGEKIVCRLLDKDNLMLDMTKLGFEKESPAFASRRRSCARGAWSS
jgi:type IV pilus assembly protein PilB